jgi:cysteine desulfurase
MRIYLDHNATTPLRPEVADAMARALRDLWGNPSSVYAEGAAARAAVERAREQVAELAGARPEEVVFTAGASEANNAVLSGVRRHLVTTTAEHPSVLEPAAALEARGVRVTRLPVDADGLVDPGALREALSPDTDLVSILWANNETGVLQPLAELAAVARAGGVPLHVDATQALGKIPLDVPVDFASASAHKLNGPKGTGCLICRRDPPVLVRGGPQERRRRGGTENVAGIVGFGAACALARAELAARAAGAGALRDRLWQALRAIPGIRRNGAPGRVLPNTLSVSIAGTEGDLLVQALDLEGVAVSSGAACHSGSVSPSHVLLAMGRSADEARATLRFSVGHGNDEAQIDAAAAQVRALVARAQEGRAA